MQAEKDALKARGYRLLNEANDAKLLGLHGKANQLHALALRAFDAYYELQLAESENN